MSAEQAFHHQAVASLYSEHHGWLQSWLRKRLGNASDAADLAQDTFVRLMAARNAAGVREPRAYLARIAHGLMVDLFRRQAIERAWLDVLAARPEPVDISPETRLVLLETLLAIDVMLDGLSPRVRQAFLMAQIEGLSYVDISQRLGVSITSVKKYMVQALTHCLLLAEG